MAARSVHTPAPRPNRLRPWIWGTAALLLLLPAVAMRFTPEVNWDETDFIVMGALLAACCGAYEVGTRLSGNMLYRAGFGMAVLGGFLLVWVNLAVGAIGGEGNPANLMYAGVLGIGMAGALLARFRARGMAVTLLVMAAAQILVPVIAWIAGWADGSPPHQLVGVTLFFLGPWLASAALFHLAARSTPEPQRSSGQQA